MIDRAPLQAQVDSLAYGDVLPVLLVTDVGYGEGLWVEVALVDPSAVRGNGYASLPLFRQVFPEAKPEEVEAVRRATLVAFAERVRGLLAQ